MRQISFARGIAAIVGGDPSNFLPFQPPRNYLTVEEADARFTKMLSSSGYVVLQKEK